jgi:rhodanese-related sulfurtransferase
MDEIVPRLWISSRDAAIEAIGAIHSPDILNGTLSAPEDSPSYHNEASNIPRPDTDTAGIGSRPSKIHALLSIGVPPATDNTLLADTDSIVVLSIPNISDTPESNILELVDVTTAFIKLHIDQDHTVLVHCQQGQSRSAAAIAAYLILDRSFDLGSALSLLKQRRTSLSINPGFLSQLHLLYHRSIFPAEYRLLNRSASSTSLNATPGADVSSPYMVRCRHCRCPLVRSDEVLLPRDDIPTCEKFSDAFWYGYWRSPRKASLTRPVLEGHVIVSPLVTRDGDARLIVGDRCKSNAGLSKSAHALLCGKCRSPVGVLTRGGLGVGGGYVLNDLLALSLGNIDHCCC